jgi:DUF4097 and DUF4098 domain-containing protein YvlB
MTLKAHLAGNVVMGFNKNVFLAIIGTSALSIAATAQAEKQHWSKILGDIEVSQGEQMGNVRSVNGSIYLEENTHVEKAVTTNGDIRVQDDVTAVALATVNGSIQLGERTRIEEDVRTVNGSIRAQFGSQIGDSMKTVNGSIELIGSTVGHDLETTNGNIELEASVIEGDVIFQEIQGYSWGNRSLPKLVIDSNSEVRGKIILRQEVRLEIDTGAKVGEIFHEYRS